MKRVLLLLAFFGLSLTGFSQTQITNVSYSSSVNLFDMLEISFDVGKTYTNPYDPDTVSIYAVFVSPTNEHHHVNAFYYEGYNFEKLYSYQHDEYYEHATPNGDNGWRIRFTPTCVGNWSFVIHGFDGNGQMQVIGSPVYNPFICNSVSNAKGFISKANSRFLKRDVMNSGHRQYESFFPVGPNVAWYDCLDYGTYQLPRGIYQYEQYIDSLAGNANYMRVFLSRYQGLSLYGPEFTEEDGSGDPVVYFNSTLNQKDAAELDYIISYAKQHDITIMPCLFNQADFKMESEDPNEVWIWENNPFSSLGLFPPSEFFAQGDAKKIAKNLIRYVVSRWGYATNIVSWELWNEVDQIHKKKIDNPYYFTIIVRKWHDEMAYYIRSIDPFNHCVSTSMGSKLTLPNLYDDLFHELDIVMEHHYLDIQYVDTRMGFPYVLYRETQKAFECYLAKPFFMGEFGFDQSQPPYYSEKDPHGIDMHNSLWSSMFSTSIGPASFWRWAVLMECKVFKRFTPLLNFSKNLPVLSDSFTAYHTGKGTRENLVFDNGLQTHYMINSAQDTIYGWSQDTVFAYTSLRRLTDTVSLESTPWGDYWKVTGGAFDPLGYVYTLHPSKRPAPSSNNNTISIPITNQPAGSRYQLQWYNTETGAVIQSLGISYVYVQQDAFGEKNITIQFPHSIRNIVNNTINNTFGDVAFSLILKNPIIKNK